MALRHNRVMMTLKQYLDWKDITQTEFALAAGITQGAVSKLCSRQRRPGWDVAARIETATGGAVPVAVWSKVAE